MYQIHRFMNAAEQLVEEGQARNPFLATLNASLAQPKAITPFQVFQSCLSELEQIAKKGDIVAWNEQLPRVFAKAEDAAVAIQEDLEIKISLCQWEMTLLLEAGNQAKLHATELKQQASQQSDVEVAARMQKKAAHFDTLGKNLHLQLREKTN